MTADLDFKLVWLVGCAIGSFLFGAGGAFAAVRVGFKQLRRDVDQTRQTMKEHISNNVSTSKEHLERIHKTENAVEVIVVKIDSLIAVHENDQRVRERAQDKHDKRLELIFENIAEINKKIK